MPKPKNITANQINPVQNQSPRTSAVSKIASFTGTLGAITVGYAFSQLPTANGLNASPSPTPTANTPHPFWKWEGNGMLPPVVWFGVSMVAVIAATIAACICLRRLRQEEWRDTKARLTLIPPPALPVIQPAIVAATPAAPVTVTVEATIEAPPEDHIGKITKSFEEWRAEDTPAANKLGDATRAVYQAAKETVTFMSAPDSEEVMGPHAHKAKKANTEITAPLLSNADSDDSSSQSELSTEPGPEQTIPNAPILEVDSPITPAVPYVLPILREEPLKSIPRPRSTRSDSSHLTSKPRLTLLSPDVQDTLLYLNTGKKPLYDV